MKLTTAIALLIGIGVLYLLGSFTFDVFVVQEAAVMSLHVAAWVPYVLGSILLFCIWLMSNDDVGSRRWIWVAIAVLVLPLFVLALRVVKFDVIDGHLIEEVGPYDFPLTVFPHVERQPPCVSVSDWVVELKSPHSSEIALFRGIWPSYFGEGAISRNFGFLKTCSGLSPRERDLRDLR